MKRNLTRYLALCAVTTLTLTFLFTQQPLNASSKAAPAGSVLQESVEDPEVEAKYARMRELQAQMDAAVKAYAKDPQNQELKDQFVQLQREFDEISGSLGGDKPTPEAAPSAAKNSPAVALAAAPVPVGCPTALTTVTADPSPNLRIPASGTTGTITSTVVVANAQPYIWDVDLITNLTHASSADLDITIQSPAGTIVTLTTDNGGSNDNVFNGTRWDDQAGTAVSDSAFANNVALTAAVPEEAMGAFIGEDPNGTWTLTIHDDAFAIVAASSIGSLDSWSLNITTLSQAPFHTTSTFQNNTPEVLANGCVGEVGGTINSPITVSGLGLFTGKVRVTTNIFHLNPDDLDITLISPSGTEVTLTTDNSSILEPNSFNGTLWDDDANPGGQVPYPLLILVPFNQGLATDRIYAFNGTASPLVPEEALAAFNGENPNGVWTLRVTDDNCNIAVGAMTGWSLEITSDTCCTIQCPSDITQSNDPNQCGATVNYPAPTTNGLCDTVTCMPPAGSFFALGTTTVNCTTTAGPSCSFNVTVNDTQAPLISCPANLNAVTAICGGTTQVVTYAAPTISDNCVGVGSVVCTPPSGSTFSVGATTVNCTVTDASNNTASCSFTVTVFNARVQDDSAPGSVLVWNTFTGEYVFCCGGTSYTGQGSAVTKGSVHTLSHTPADRRVTAKIDCAVKRGEGTLQFTVGSLRCSITDRNITNSTGICAAVVPLSK